MDRKTLAALCITIFLWGSAFVAIRIATVHYSAGGLALLRILIGAVILLPITARYVFKKVDFRWMDIPHIIILATIGLSLYHFFLNYGERSVSAGVSSFLVGQAPIISAILALCFYKERVPFWGGVGLVISVAGVSLIALAGDGGMAFTIGLLAVIGCAFCSGIYSVFIKPLLLRYHPMALTTYLMWAATLWLLPYGPDLIHDLHTAPLKDTFAVIYLGIFPTAIGYMTWSYALMHLPTFRATCWMFMLPLVSCLLGWLILGEIPGLLTFLGGVIAMGGAILVTLSKHKAKAIEKKEIVALEDS
jgi:drug/metabolite transporter (DMT)-like permease